MGELNIRKYFNRKKPIGAILLIILGICFLNLGISARNGFMWVIIGLLVGGIGVYRVYLHCTYQSDKEVDLFCERLAQEYYSDNRVEIDSKKYGRIEKLEAYEYCFENAFRSRKAIKGKDGFWRSTILKIHSFYMVDEMAYYFEKKISLISEEKVERKKEFKINEIQMISIENNNQTSCLVIAIPGNEKIRFKYRDRNKAIEMSEKIKNFGKVEIDCE